MSEVRLRPITEADLPDFVAWMRSPEVTEFLTTEAGALTPEGAQEWFAHVSDVESRDRHWAVEAEGRHIGGTSLELDAAGQQAEFAITIGDTSAWGKGYGTAAAQSVLRIGFAEMGLHRIHLTVFADNLRGLRCYEKCGFRREGHARQCSFTGGKWHDQVRMALLREEWEVQQAIPADADGGVSLRPYRSTDHPAVHALLEQTGFHVGPNDTAEAIDRKLATQPGFFFVAEADGRIVGTVIGSLERGWGWIQRLAVHPDYRRRGIAKRLIQEAERTHAALGAYRTVLLTHKDNAAAQALYRSAGYELWENVIVMSRTLEPSEGEHGD